MPAAIVVEGQFDRNYDQLRLGFLKGSNPSAFKRLMTFAQTASPSDPSKMCG